MGWEWCRLVLAIQHSRSAAHARTMSTCNERWQTNHNSAWIVQSFVSSEYSGCLQENWVSHFECEFWNSPNIVAIFGLGTLMVCVCVFAASLTRMSRCSNQFIGRHKRRTLLASHRRRLANKWNGSRLPNEKKKHMRDHGTSSNRTTTKQILYPFICNSISIIITLLNIEIYDHYGEPAVSGSSKTQDKEKTKKKNKSTIIIIGVTMAI